MVEIPSGFQCIVADPPWKVKAGPGGLDYCIEDGKQVWNSDSRPARDLAYPTMTVDEISALPVSDLAADDAHLYLWTINKYVDAAYGVARAWGFTPSTLLTWAKAPMGGGLGGTFGISSEYILFCRRGTLKAKNRITGTWFNWKRPYDERGKPKHSAKPEELQDMAEHVTPGPYLELFSRRRRVKWASWGNELDSDITIHG